MTQPNKAKRRPDGLLRVTGTNAETIETALLVGIEEGSTMIQSFKDEMEKVQAVMDHPDATPELVEKGKAYKAALERLTTVTSGIVADHQSALYSTMRGPI